MHDHPRPTRISITTEYADGSGTTTVTLYDPADSALTHRQAWPHHRLPPVITGAHATDHRNRDRYATITTPRHIDHAILIQTRLDGAWQIDSYPSVHAGTPHLPLTTADTDDLDQALSTARWHLHG